MRRTALNYVTAFIYEGDFIVFQENATSLAVEQHNVVCIVLVCRNDNRRAFFPECLDNNDFDGLGTRLAACRAGSGRPLCAGPSSGGQADHALTSRVFVRRGDLPSPLVAINWC